MIILTREEAEQVFYALDSHCNAKKSKAMKTLLARLSAPEPKPVAWRTFDGEGGYDYRHYELNEDYGYWWEERHPNHKNWVEPLYVDPTPCQTCEALARTVMMDQTSHDTAPPQREWQGLTDEEIEALSIKHTPPIHPDFTEDDDFIEFARAIEAKLKEKNNG